MLTDCKSPTRLKAFSRREFVGGLGQAGLGLAAWHTLPGPMRRALFAQTTAEPLRARLKIDPERRLGTIDPNLSGNFIEHLGRCIYGGIYEGSWRRSRGSMATRISHVSTGRSSPTGRNS